MQSVLNTPFCRQVGVQYPIICGAMYPCTNPELVAAVSEAGGMGVVQPLSMIYVYGHELHEGLRMIRRLTAKPFGFNALIEASSRVYLERMKRWLDIALEEGARFIVSSLGNPRWVVERAASCSAVVYHDVTDRRWALKALDAGAHGLICVNNHAGGHAGGKDAETLYRELSDLKVPLICAGGVGDEKDFVAALKLGYAGVQMGTRFIATAECGAHPDYKEAIVRAKAPDIVLTERVTGVPLSVIRTPRVEREGTRAGWLARRLLKRPRLKHWMRLAYSLRSFIQFKRANLRPSSTRDYYQAGKSVESIRSIESAGDVVRRFAAAAGEK